MAGALAGALRGVGALPTHILETIKAVNSEEISSLADGLAEVAWRRYSGT
jgi:ADP-ribosylglycohydrolase